MSSVTPLPEVSPRLNPPVPSVKIELDERCLVFPDGKAITHLLLTALPNRRIAIDAVFAFNQTRRNPRIAELSLDEARGFARELVNAVYYAKTAFFLADSVRIAINVAPNGYHLELMRADDTVEVMLGIGSIWRFIKGFLLAIDSAAPVIAH